MGGQSAAKPVDRGTIAQDEEEVEKKLLRYEIGVQAARLIVDGLIRQLVHLAIQLQITGGMKLAHENDDHFFLGINGERGVEKATPSVLPGCAQLGQRGLDSLNAEAETERLIGCYFPQLIVGHQFDGLAAENACVSEFSAFEQHLAEARIIRGRGIRCRRHRRKVS